MSWNMYVTGKSGCGKTKFAMLLKRYLRAYGAIDKDLFVDTAASELMDSSDRLWPIELAYVVIRRYHGIGTDGLVLLGALPS